MKANKKSSLSSLPVDVLDYLFVEWLIRQGLFSAYKANYEKFHPNHRSFRDNLRDEFYSLLRSSHLGIQSAISVSFPFLMTSEGYDFWVDKSNRWRRFCAKFKSIF